MWAPLDDVVMGGVSVRCVDVYVCVCECVYECMSLLAGTRHKHTRVTHLRFSLWQPTRGTCTPCIHTNANKRDENTATSS
jgi:hypothetical protein